tara:strand:- start:723 stop:2939 length:2217 start_codon:yes stop_codon:yes gene_type:complete
MLGPQEGNPQDSEQEFEPFDFNKDGIIDEIERNIGTTLRLAGLTDEQSSEMVAELKKDAINPEISIREQIEGFRELDIGDNDGDKERFLYGVADFLLATRKQHRDGLTEAGRKAFDEKLSEPDLDAQSILDAPPPTTDTKPLPVDIIRNQTPLYAAGDKNEVKPGSGFDAYDTKNKEEIKVDVYGNRIVDHTKQTGNRRRRRGQTAGQRRHGDLRDDYKDIRVVPEKKKKPVDVKKDKKPDVPVPENPAPDTKPSETPSPAGTPDTKPSATPSPAETPGTKPSATPSPAGTPETPSQIVPNAPKRIPAVAGSPHSPDGKSPIRDKYFGRGIVTDRNSDGEITQREIEQAKIIASDSSLDNLTFKIDYNNFINDSQMMNRAQGIDANTFEIEYLPGRSFRVDAYGNRDGVVDFLELESALKARERQSGIPFSVPDADSEKNPNFLPDFTSVMQPGKETKIPDAEGFQIGVDRDTLSDLSNQMEDALVVPEDAQDYFEKISPMLANMMKNAPSERERFNPNFLIPKNGIMPFSDEYFDLEAAGEQHLQISRQISEIVDRATHMDRTLRDHPGRMSIQSMTNMLLGYTHQPMGVGDALHDDYDYGGYSESGGDLIYDFENDRYLDDPSTPNFDESKTYEDELPMGGGGVSSLISPAQTSGSQVSNYRIQSALSTGETREINDRISTRTDNNQGATQLAGLNQMQGGGAVSSGPSPGRQSSSAFNLSKKNNVAYPNWRTVVG